LQRSNVDFLGELLFVMRPGRNDTCPCGSGKKFKKCCADKFEVGLSDSHAPVKVSRPTAAELNHLVELLRAGDYLGLESRSRLLVEQYPDSGLVWKLLAISLQAQGKMTLSALQKAAELLPEDANIHNDFGVALYGQGRFKDAEENYLRALKIKSDFAEAHSNLGQTLEELGQFDEAVASYRLALEINPDLPVTQSNLGNALHTIGINDEAVECCHRALELKPDYAYAHSNLGNSLHDLGQLDDAVASYRRALEILPDYSTAHYNLGTCLLSSGMLSEGWLEFEWRWLTPQLINDRRDFVQPQWRGEKAEGQTLLIHAEQGFGDTLQFCRYAPLAASRGLRVILIVQPPLFRLLSQLPDIDLVIKSGDELPPFDLHCPMLSLPLAFGTTMATIPNISPYLQANKVQVEAWHTRLAALPEKGCRIGLVWAGNPRSEFPQAAATDRRRSMPLEQLTPLFELSGINIFSLQKGGTESHRNYPLNDFMDEMNDFADTAALIANLDLVISVDTAVAHLAAALGKPVWILNRYDSCWRWFRERQDSPWYPSVRLFRQPKPGDWQSVIEKVVEELVHLTNGNLYKFKFLSQTRRE